MKTIISILLIIFCFSDSVIAQNDTVHESNHKNKKSISTIIDEMQADGIIDNIKKKTKNTKTKSHCLECLHSSISSLGNIKTRKVAIFLVEKLELQTGIIYEYQALSPLGLFAASGALVRLDTIAITPIFEGIAAKERSKCFQHNAFSTLNAIIGNKKETREQILSFAQHKKGITKERLTAFAQLPEELYFENVDDLIQQVKIDTNRIMKANALLKLGELFSLPYNYPDAFFKPPTYEVTYPHNHSRVKEVADLLVNNLTYTKPTFARSLGSFSFTKTHPALIALLNTHGICSSLGINKVDQKENNPFTKAILDNLATHEIKEFDETLLNYADQIHKSIIISLLKDICGDMTGFKASKWLQKIAQTHYTGKEQERLLKLAESLKPNYSSVVK